MSEFFLVERRGPAAIVTLNRPEKQNALSTACLDAIADVMDELDRDPEVRGIVLTGSPKVFSTGGDLDEGLALKGPDSIRRWLDAFARANGRIEAIGTPVIAAIRGYCLTGGLELALACDIRIAARGSKFGITSSKIGTVPGAGATQRLARLVGAEWAKEILFSANFLDAEQALSIRLVSQVADPEEVVNEAVARIKVYAERAPLSISYAKFAVNNGLQMPLEAALHYERQITTTLFMSDDKREGMAAFLEKRPTKFTGQ